MLERLWLQIRGMGIYFFIPIIGYFIFIPFCVKILNSSATEAEERFFTLQKMCYQFVPILSTIWIYIFHKEYVEGEGREILLLGKGISALTFLFWGVNIMCLFVLFLLGDNTNGKITDLFWEMIIVTFMICGLVFFLNFAVNRISFSVLAVMLYIMLANVDLENFFSFRTELAQIQQIEGYFYTVLKDGGLFSSEAQMYLVIGTLFWLFGLLEARRL